MSPISALRSVVAELEADAARARYRTDIVAYARERHGAWLWGRQREVCEAVAVPPCKVMVQSANAVGKTYLMGLLVAWFYDTFDPGVGICTAPVFKQIADTTFKEARKFLGVRAGLLPKNPGIYDHPSHYFDGRTATGATSFQGTHDHAQMLLYEEATGIPGPFWTAGRSMMVGSGQMFWLASLNPTDSTSAAKLEAEGGDWNVIRIAAFEHPNILAGLCGLDPPIAGAVSLGPLLSNMKAWGDLDRPYADEREKPEEVDLHDPRTYGFDEAGTHQEVNPQGDTVTPEQVVEGAKKTFPARYWRPGSDGEARIMGQYPSQATRAIFSEAAFDRAFARNPNPVWTEGVHGGLDVARYGSDDSCLHMRVGMTSRYHENRSKQGTDETAGWAKRVCGEIAVPARREPWTIPVLIDDTGVGGGVVDQRVSVNRLPNGSEVSRSYSFVPVNFGQVARDEEKYPNARSEMLFDLAELLAHDKINLGGMGREAFLRVRSQATKVQYGLDKKGRRVAETKDEQRKRLGRSPDDLDALALCYYQPATEGWVQPPPVAELPPPPRRAIERDDSSSDARSRYRM